MNSLTKHCLAGAIASFVFACPSGAEDMHFGMIEYEIACLPCHGIDGRGNGPLADRLPSRPTDLTGIAKANGGTFPAADVERIVDGRTLVDAHHQRSMPLWGERYRQRVEENETAATIEQRGRARVRALVDYLASIQER